MPACPPIRRRTQLLLLATALPQSAALQPAAARAQDLQFTEPPATLEARLRADDFTILDWRGSRMPNDRTQVVLLAFTDSAVMHVKWANAPANGAAFNNEPRYEAAAYEFQKLFLDPADYVVPPTVLRAMPLALVADQMSSARPTFGEAPMSVLVALQYWLRGVQQDGFWDEHRARDDTLYARHIGNFNIFTYLIRHRDANAGNYLIASEGAPRVFSVDNGVSFRSEPSSRGTAWRNIRVRRLPGSTIDRLERITREDLDRVLGVIAEFEVRDGQLVAVTPGPNLNPGRGVRRTSDRIQLGLTSREINDVENRLHELVKRARDGRYELF